jgi:hypothetical protein
MKELCPYLPLWIQVRDQNIPSREGISKQFWRFLWPLIIASFASSTAVVQKWSRFDVDLLVLELPLLNALATPILHDPDDVNRWC